MATSEQICCVCLITGNNFESLTKKDTDNISLLNKFKKCIWEVVSFYIIVNPIYLEIVVLSYGYLRSTFAKLAIRL